MRLILGLDRPTAGTVTVNGKAYRDYPAPLHEVGALLEARAVHTGRSAYNHLLALAQTHGVPKRHVHDLIERVGLTEVARKRVGKFSLGMGQRLGIASALLGDPATVILDEPANGLDPEGMRWMRAVLRDFADRGGTVLLSSHLLGEVQMIADRLVVIARGQIVAQGSPSELLGTAARTVVRTADGPSADRLLRRALAEEEILMREGPDGSFVTEADPNLVGRAALRGGVALAELRPASDGSNLEQLFFELTSDTKPETETESHDLLEVVR
jgi:ABC-2 type transport system ATP-binding protein